MIKPDQVLLAFSSPDGPAVLKLGRSNGQTTIDLVQKIPAAAERSGVMPKPGQANLSFINASQSDAVFTINERTFRIAAGSGVRRTCRRRSVCRPANTAIPWRSRTAGASNEIELTADDNTGLTIGATEVTPQPVY